ncbi:MAG: L,D-transpeptidase [Bradyrhizobium sp.]|nr:L,D-transpeptidase [Bradyrhizobium sp.]
MRNVHVFLSIMILALSVSVAHASQRLDEQTIEKATFSGKRSAAHGTSPLLVKVEVLLDRAHFSPGEIDGNLGENVKKALTAYADAHDLPADPPLTNETVSSLSADTQPILTQYVLTDSDLKGPFTEHIPAKMEEMKGMKRVDYRNPKEAIAEKFHVSEKLLGMLNPGTSFNQVGQQIVVPNVLVDESKGPVTKIDIDKDRQTVKAYGPSGELVAFYPATVGSKEKPSPIGTFKIISIDRNPTYRYDPKYKFKGIKTNKPFVIGPGPNNPVGLVWIGLSADGYGIHGTADPSRVSKSESHGCVRLTNWDALALASMVKKGMPVQFADSSVKTSSEAN